MMPPDTHANAGQSIGSFASAILYVLVARGFNSRRWGLNIVVGLVLSSAVLAMFNYGLGLTLPPGILKGVLP